MFTAVVVLIVLVCVLLGLSVLVQNSKGGGLTSSFAGSTQIMGVRKTSDFIEKFTWSLAIALVVLCLAANFTIPHGDSAKQGSSMQEQIDNAQAPAEQQAPAQQQAQPAQQAPAQK